MDLASDFHSSRSFNELAASLIRSTGEGSSSEVEGLFILKQSDTLDLGATFIRVQSGTARRQSHATGSRLMVKS
jgi:hypothetical protein